MVRKIFLSFLILIFTFFSFGYRGVFSVSAQTPTDTPTPTPTPSDSGNSSTVQQLEQQIEDLQSKINDLQGQEKTLSTQITVMDNQIQLTQLRINATKQQILNLALDIDTANTKITKLQNSLDGLTQTLLSRIVATYEVGSVQPFHILLASNNISDFFVRENYLKIVQEHDRRLVFDTVQAKNDYANQKAIFEDKKKQIVNLQSQLVAYTQDLDNQKSQKQQLLTETQGSEENYQRILAQTKAQLASFEGFVSSQGGASILSNQTVCDDWGCYYNQRDSQWGNNALNATAYSLASDGCLITSMAMVYTHYGHRDVTPQSINANSSNFSGIPSALLKYSVTANGVSSERMGTDIDSTLASGNPVVVGISYDGGPYPDHFVVFVSGSAGDYIMNDPFTPNGHNISFRGRYPSVRIVEEDKVTF